MENKFKESIFREISYGDIDISGNVIKSKDINIIGTAKVDVEEDNHSGVKVILKKDASDNIKEIKFVCSCGETKSVLLDYSDE